MEKLYSASQIGKMVGVTPETIKRWADAELIPRGSQQGLHRKWVWRSWKVRQILDFARDNGFIIHDWVLPDE